MLYIYFFFFQAEDGIRDLVRSRGLGDVYKRQDSPDYPGCGAFQDPGLPQSGGSGRAAVGGGGRGACLLYTSDAADGRSRVDLGGRRII